MEFVICNRCKVRTKKPRNSNKFTCPHCSNKLVFIPEKPIVKEKPVKKKEPVFIFTDEDENGGVYA